MASTPLIPLAARMVVAALGARLVYLIWSHALGAADVRLYHVHTAATWLVVAGIASLWWRPASTGAVVPQAAHRISQSWLLACIGGSALLYWPAFGLGALSDDFVLVERAATWSLGPVTPILFRPLPLGAWAGLLSLGGGTVALHGLSIVLHGANAYLASILASRWLPAGPGARLAGALVLTSPLHGEAVVWLSGAFDVMATTAMLIATLVFRTYTTSATAKTRVVFAIAAVAALASKETSVVLPLLVAVAAAPDWRRLPRAAVFDLAIVTLLTLGYGSFRAWNAGAVGETLSIGRYELQRTVFAALGALAAPWRGAEVTSPAVVATTTLVVGLLVRAFVSGSGASFRPVVLGALWVMAAIVPVASSLVIGPDLEGSRYVYAASIGWAVIVAGLGTVASRGGTRPRWPLVAVVAICAQAAMGVRAHLGPWSEAGRLRDAVLASAAADSRIAACSTVRVTGLPDAVAGAYVFRNGAPEAFRSVAGVHLDDAATSECQFRWHSEVSGFAPDAGLRKP